MASTTEQLAPDRSEVGGAWGGSRREFLRLAASAAAALGLTGGLTGCVLTAAGTRRLDFHDDFGVLNYAYALETLESRFYERVVAAPPADLRPGELEILTDIRDHEVAHRRFFKRSLQILRVEVPPSVWPGIDFSSRESVLTTARTFEDLGVAAYNGAGHHLQLAEFLTIAGKIVSVEARHAAVLRDMLSTDGRAFASDDIVDEHGMDRAMEPREVLAATERYFTTPYRVAGI